MKGGEELKSFGLSNDENWTSCYYDGGWAMNRLGEPAGRVEIINSFLDMQYLIYPLQPIKYFEQIVIRYVRLEFSGQRVELIKEVSLKDMSIGEII